MGLGITPLILKIMLESNLLKSIILVRRLAVLRCRREPCTATTQTKKLESRSLSQTGSP